MEKEVVVDTSIFRENDRRLSILLNFRKIAGLVNFCLFILRLWTIKVNPGTLFTSRHPPPPPPSPYLPFPQLAKLSKENKTDVTQSLC